MTGTIEAGGKHKLESGSGALPKDEGGPAFLTSDYHALVGFIRLPLSFGSANGMCRLL